MIGYFSYVPGSYFVINVIKRMKKCKLTKIERNKKGRESQSGKIFINANRFNRKAILVSISEIIK